MESLFFPPKSSFFLPSPPRLPRVHGVNCVHFNYDLISEERWGAPRGGWSTGMPLCMCGFGWIVSRGHDLRTGCYWVSVVPPRPWPSLSSNNPPPPEDPQVHMHTNTHTPISSSSTPCFINAPRTSHCASLPLPIFFQCFPTCLVCVFLPFFQCNMSTNGQRGECWCVNPFTGVQIPATPKVRGDPNCNQFQEELRVMPTAAAVSH